MALDDASRALIRDLLVRSRVLSLAVLVDGAPLVGMLPFAPSRDFRFAVVHASRLARHTDGLAPAAPFGVLLHEPDGEEKDARQLARLSLEGTVRPLAGTADEAAARALYLARFPDSAPIFELGDFALYALDFARGRVVGGFAAARNVNADDLADAAAAPPA